MFYSTQILAKKGPLGTIWIAAHLDRRLKRHQVFETNIAISVDSIINPEAPLALRLSGQLLLGVVKVYSRKVGYLFEDCNGALRKIEQMQAIDTTGLDLPTDGGIAPKNIITLPENYNAISFMETPFDNQPFKMSKRNSILLADDISLFLGSQTSLDGEERFEVSGDELERRMSFSLEAPEVLRREMHSQQDAPLYGEDDTPGSFDADARMDPVPEGMFDDLPSSIARQAPQQDAEPVQMPTPENNLKDLDEEMDALPAVQNDLIDQTPQLEAIPDPTPEPAAQRGAVRGQREKKRRAQLDVDKDHKPETVISGNEIRKLLKDSAPLLRPRSELIGQFATLATAPIHVALYDEEAADNPILRPAFCAAMAQPLLEVIARRYAGAAAPAVGRSKRRRHAPAAQMEALEAAAEAAVQREEDVQEPPPLPPADEAPLDFEPAHIGDEPAPYEEDGIVADAAGPAPEEHDNIQRASPSRSSHRTSRGDDLGHGLGSPSTTANGSLGEIEANQEQPGGAKTSFTARTRHVAARLKAEFEGNAGKKKRRLQTGAAHAGVSSISLDGLVDGKSRIDACRWFFEVLVLKTSDYIDLEQAQPYEEINIKPCKLLATA